MRFWCWLVGHKFYLAQPNYEEFPGFWARGCKRCNFVERLEPLRWNFVDELKKRSE